MAQNNTPRNPGATIPAGLLDDRNYGAVVRIEEGDITTIGNMRSVRHLNLKSGSLLTEIYLEGHEDPVTVSQETEVTVSYSMEARNLYIMARNSQRIFELLDQVFPEEG